MISNYIINIFTPTGFVDFIGLLIIVLELLYLFVSFIIMREVALMNRSLKTDAAKLFTVSAFIHFMLALILLVISIATL